MRTRVTALIFAGFIAACGGGGGDGGDAPQAPPLRPGQTEPDANSQITILQPTLGGDYGTANAQVLIRGSIVSKEFHITWSNSAGGSGDTFPYGVDCDPRFDDVCKSYEWFVWVPLSLGEQTVTIVARNDKGADTRTMKITRI